MEEEREILTERNRNKIKEEKNEKKREIIKMISKEEGRKVEIEQ
jgi:hypothetical protein